MTALRAATADRPGARASTLASGMAAPAGAGMQAAAMPSLASSACSCGGSCPRCTAASALGGGALSALAIQRDADPSPPPDFVEDKSAVPAQGGDPGFDDGSAAEGPGTGGDKGQQDEEPVAAVQAASDGAGPAVAASPTRASPAARADRVAASLGSGAPLSPALHRRMTTFFGEDIGDVRVHADGGAGATARSLHAHAFTVGNHVAFASGRYRPEHPDGQRLLAHELTHVMQQRRSLDPDIRRAGIGSPGDRYEAEAERNATRFASGQRAEAGATAGAASATDGGALQLYTASAASAYARTWALSTNPAYPRAGNDCTNFVSQAVTAGGWTPVGGSCDDRTKDTAWWFGGSNCWWPGVDRSYTWGGAQNFFNFMSASGRATSVGRIADLDVGDVLQVAHGGHVGHTTMVTGKPAGNLLLSYHTNDTLDLPVWGAGGFLSRYVGSSTPTTYYAWKL